MGTDSFLGDATQTLLVTGILVSLAFYAVTYYSGYCFTRRSRRVDPPGSDPGPLPAVTILKPLKGLEFDLYHNLASFCRQDYPRFQVVFGVADPRDPAVQVVRRLQADYPEVDIELVTDRRVYGTNYKISNLHNMYRAAAHEMIAVADSDIRVGRDYLRRIVAPLADPQVGLVTSLYRAVNAGHLPTLIESLFINTDFVPMVLAARILEKPTYAFGATIVLRRSTLEEIGGFLALADYLADDYHLGHRVAARGYRLVLSDLVVETVLHVGSWKRLLDHQLRWARTYRNCRPGGYFGSILTHGTLWATLNVLYNQTPMACLVAAAVCAARIATARAIAGRCIDAPLSFGESLLIPIKDLFISLVWAVCFLGDTVHWSGHDFRVLKSGHLVRISSPSIVSPQTAPYAVREERDRHPASIY